MRSAIMSSTDKIAALPSRPTSITSSDPGLPVRQATRQIQLRTPAPSPMYPTTRRHTCTARLDKPFLPQLFFKRGLRAGYDVEIAGRERACGKQLHCTAADQDGRLKTPRHHPAADARKRAKRRFEFGTIWFQTFGRRFTPPSSPRPPTPAATADPAAYTRPAFPGRSCPAPGRSAPPASPGAGWDRAAGPSRRCG